MSSSYPPGSSLPPDHGPEFDTLLDDFDAAWESGTPPDLYEYLRPNAPYHADLLRELVQIDLERRLRRLGGDARLEEYLARYPELVGDTAFLFALVGVEYRWRLMRGEVARREEYYQRFPEHREELRRLLIASTAQQQTQRGDPPLPITGPVGLPTVPGYEVLGPLGRGSMGVVYRARDVQLNRPVALKMLLHGGMSSPELLGRFDAEARVVAALGHPNIVQVFQLGTQDGLPFLALEYLEGGSLANRMADGPMPPRDAASLLVVLAQAMHHAHERGVIHRDLKPANILLTLDGTVKVADFGLARLRDAPNLTHGSHAVLGTPAYMAPEQAEGRIKEVGPAADLYALGTILYEALIGKPPFLAASSHEVMELVRTQEPVPLRALQPSIPRDLETVCLKCLEKEPQHRYATADDLAEDLRRFLDGEPIRARRPWPWERLAKWARRRPAAAGLVALSVLVLLGVAAAGVSRAAAERARIAADLRKVVEDLAAGQSAIARDRSDDWSVAAKELEEAQKRIASEPALSHLGEPIDEVLNQLRSRMAFREAKDEAIATRQEFLRLRDQALVQLHHTLLEPHLSLSAFAPPTPAQGKLKLDRFDLNRGAPPAEDRPPSLAEQSARSERQTGVPVAWEALRLHTRLQEALAQHGDALLPEGDRRQHDTDARELFRTVAYVLRENNDLAGEAKFLAALPRAREGEDPAAAFLRGVALLERPDEAIRHFDEAIRLREDHFAARFLRAALNLRQGLLITALGDLSRCIALRPGFAWGHILRGYAQGVLAFSSNAQQAHPLFEGAERDFSDAEKYAAADDRLARGAALNSRGVVRWMLGRAEEGRNPPRPGQEHYDQAITDFMQARRLLPDLVSAPINLAHALEAREKYDAALHALDAAQALTSSTEDRHETRRLRATLHRSRARLLMKQNGTSEQVLEALRAALREEPFDAPSANAAHDHLECAFLFAKAQDYEAAVCSCEEALTLKPGYAEAHYFEANLLVQLGRHTDAVEAFERAAHACAAPVDRSGTRTGLALRLQAEVRERQGIVLSEFLGRHTEAIDCLSEALAVGHPEPVRVRQARGWAALAVGAERFAEADFREVLRMRPSDPEARMGLARILAEDPNRGALAEHETRQVLKWVAGEKLSRRLTSYLEYSAACVFARLAEHLDRRGQATGAERREYLNQAYQLLFRVAKHLPEPVDRAAFWHSRLARDPALRSLLRYPNDELPRLRQAFGVN